MKNLRKLYPGYFNLLFIHFNYKEKKSVLALFLLISANSSLYFISLSGNMLFDSIQGFVVVLNIAVFANFLFSNTQKFNQRVVKEFYQIDILRYTKAFQLELMRSVFIRNIAIKYDKYEDLMADYDDEPPAPAPNVKKSFWKLFLLLTGLIGFLGSFLLDGATLKAKLAYLILVSGFILIPIILLSLLFLPIIKDHYHYSYKKDKAIISIMKEIKEAIDQFSPKYIVSVDLKTLIINSKLLEKPFLVLFPEYVNQKA